MSITVTVPGCPHPYLSSNGRANWRGKARVTKEARGDAKLATKGALAGGSFSPERAVVDVVIGWGKNRKRIDPTNLWACVKPHIDGVADALEVNDRHFDVGTIEQVRDPEGVGYVEITVRSTDDPDGFAGLLRRAETE